MLFSVIEDIYHTSSRNRSAFVYHSMLFNCMLFS